jgi:hypothetical protein
MNGTNLQHHFTKPRLPYLEDCKNIISWDVTLCRLVEVHRVTEDYDQSRPKYVGLQDYLILIKICYVDSSLYSYSTWDLLNALQ